MQCPRCENETIEVDATGMARCKCGFGPVPQVQLTNAVTLAVHQTREARLRKKSGHVQ